MHYLIEEVEQSHEDSIYGRTLIACLQGLVLDELFYYGEAELFEVNLYAISCYCNH
jgi:hypothetical protein